MQQGRRSCSKLRICDYKSQTGLKLDSHQRRASVFSARFDGRQTFVYAILKHSALFKAIRLLNLFHHNTKIPERNILWSITTKLTIRATSKTHATLTSPLVRIQLNMVVPPIACGRTTSCASGSRTISSLTSHKLTGCTTNRRCFPRSPFTIARHDWWYV